MVDRVSEIIEAEIDNITLITFSAIEREQIALMRNGYRIAMSTGSVTRRVRGNKPSGLMIGRDLVIAFTKENTVRDARASVELSTIADLADDYNRVIRLIETGDTISTFCTRFNFISDGGIIESEELCVFEATFNLEL